jgi:hypothetical protein
VELNTPVNQLLLLMNHSEELTVVFVETKEIKIWF